MPPPPEWNEIHSGWRQRWKKRLASDGEAGMLAVAEAFGLMMEHGICPDWVLEEARWDAMSGIREMAAGDQPWPLSGQDQFTLISRIHASEPTATAESLSARFGCENKDRIEPDS